MPRSSHPGQNLALCCLVFRNTKPVELWEKDGCPLHGRKPYMHCMLKSMQGVLAPFFYCYTNAFHDVLLIEADIFTLQLLCDFFASHFLQMFVDRGKIYFYWLMVLWFVDQQICKRLRC